MTDFPTQVFILGERFEITRSNHRLAGCPSGRTYPDGRPMMGFLEGFYQRVECLIGVSPTLGDGENARECLLHEIVHALDDAMIPSGVPRAATVRRPRGRCRRRWPPRQLPRPVHLTEETVHAWARGLYAAVRDPRNRPVFEWIFGHGQTGLLFPAG